MAEGYIALYRILLDKPIWQKSSPEHKVILITLLLMANHEENEWEWMGQKFKVFPGQFVTSLDSIKNACGKGISLQNIRSALARFQKLEFLTNDSTKCGRFITILKWHTYQVELMKGNKDTNKEVTKNQQRGNKEVTSNKNDKNDKNDKKKDIGDLISEFTQNEDLKTALHDFVQMRIKNRKPMTDKAISLLLIKLKSLSLDENTQIKILEQSISGSWSGIYELKNNLQVVKSSFKPPSNKDFEQRTYSDDYFDNLAYKGEAK